MNYTPTYQQDDVEVISRERVFQGFFAVDKLSLKHRRYAGDWSPSFSRELFCRGRAVGVLLHDPEQDQLVLVEQFRVGLLDNAQQSPWVLELVAGIIDEGESPEQVATREVQEEAGLQVNDLRFICEYYNSPGGSDECISVFYGRVDASQADGIHGLADEHEDIKVVVLPVADALAALQAGKINNAMAIIALQWFRLQYVCSN
ncbi:NUDIX domain-containing protein [Pseudohongiella spirulinae]|uniref:NUDIX domain-containing protein n=1 Tax=Pseudohongiella spirulinae TaxID=1249552 RepID=UPI001F33553B|nr:NUDIX domain-containing protein [Pseudohongiella spirulinae]